MTEPRRHGREMTPDEVAALEADDALRRRCLSCGADDCAHLVRVLDVEPPHEPPC